MDRSLELAEDQALPNWLRREIGVERLLKHFARHAASALRYDTSENDVAAPVREITSRHRVDKRLLSPLAARCALEADECIPKTCDAAPLCGVSRSLWTECLASKAGDVDDRPSRVFADWEALTLTSLSIPTGYEYDCFTRMVTEFKRGGWSASRR